MIIGSCVVGLVSRYCNNSKSKLNFHGAWFNIIFMFIWYRFDTLLCLEKWLFSQASYNLGTFPFLIGFRRCVRPQLSTDKTTSIRGCQVLLELVWAYQLPLLFFCLQIHCYVHSDIIKHWTWFQLDLEQKPLKWFKNGKLTWCCTNWFAT